MKINDMTKIVIVSVLALAILMIFASVEPLVLVGFVYDHFVVGYIVVSIVVIGYAVWSNLKRES